MDVFLNDTQNGTGNGSCVGETPAGFQILTKFLLFFLVFGLAASVEFEHFTSKFKNVKGIMTGVLCQFFLLPLLGFACIVALDLEPVFAIMLLVTVSSPGGSYSNWWCSLFNADLALSVAMTTVSNVVALGMLPLNMFIYLEVLYPMVADIDVESGEGLNFVDLLLSLGVLLVAIISGVTAAKFKPEWRDRFNILGNVFGVALIAVGFAVSSSSCRPWTSYDAKTYIAIAIPPISAIILSSVIGTCFRLEKAERVAVGIETSYQNTGLALDVAFSFSGASGFDAGSAAGVPTVYSMFTILVMLTYCLVSWKCGWTLAPKSDPIYKVVTHNYQHEDDSESSDNKLSVDFGDRDSSSHESERTPALSL